MNIISAEFFLFTAAVLVVFYLLPRKFQNAWLLIASHFFYSTWSWHFSLILFGVTIINYLAGMYIEKRSTHNVTIWLLIALNILYLVLFKTLNSPYAFGLLFNNNPSALNSQNWIMQFFLPVGFSFYILQAISYLVDISQKRLPASRNFWDFSLYMAYFPKLLSGPIERAKSFLPILRNERIVDNQLISKAIALIIIGLFRRLVIADLVNGLRQNEYLIKETNGWAGMINLLMFGLYLYNDFCGYTNIIRGISCLFGIELSPNFMQPFFSRSFSEFWTRWHISLSEWLRDYIFFPLSRWLLLKNNNKRNLINTYVPPLVTMLASGLWHGFNPAMIFWGGMHGFFLILERFVLLKRPGFRPNEGSYLKQFFAGITIFILVTFAWAPFIIGGLRQTFDFWAGLPKYNLDPIQPFDIIWSIFLGLISLGLDFVQYRNKDEVTFLKWKLFPKAAVSAFAIICLIVVTFWNMNIPSQVFVYQGF